MPFMTPFEFCDIILVPFPFTDQSATKKRPAVVISSKPYIQDRQAAGLLKPSAIKPVITTIEKSLIIQTLGRLNDYDRNALQENLKVILG